MELKNILKGIEGVKAKGNIDIDVQEIRTDSREVKTGDMFVAIKGFECDGHQFIPQAIEKGAKVILVNENVVIKIMKLLSNKYDDITILSAKDTRIALSKCACNFYDNPSRKFKLVGITGTKGKTTTSFMIKSILEKQKMKVGLIGTIATYIGNKKIEDSDRTTPDSLKLQQIFSKMAESKVDVCIMEVSSQSLKLHRVDYCDFDIGVFTNFSEDHISPKEHPNMEDYFNSKLRLFEMARYGFVNQDDFNSNRVPKLCQNCKIKTYGIDNDADYLAKDITITNSYVDFKLKIDNKNERIKTFIPGRFSVYNSLAAICVSNMLGANIDSIRAGLEEVRVPGRSEVINNKFDLTIMIDYAHSPESLQSILQAVKAYTRGKVISVFGCGGDRDTGKRPTMGEISGKIADYTIITSDNPRTEDPKKIVEQIEEGIKKTKGKYEIIVNRTEAIEKAVSIASKKDIVVLAGKGHETYQEINHVKYPYDEREILKQIFEKMDNDSKKDSTEISKKG